MQMLFVVYHYQTGVAYPHSTQFQCSPWSNTNFKSFRADPMYPGPVQESCNWMYTIRDWGTVGLNIVYLLLFIVFFLFKTPVDCSLKKNIKKSEWLWEWQDFSQFWKDFVLVCGLGLHCLPISFPLHLSLFFRGKGKTPQNFTNKTWLSYKASLPIHNSIMKREKAHQC